MINLKDRKCMAPQVLLNVSLKKLQFTDTKTAVLPIHLYHLFSLIFKSQPQHLHLSAERPKGQQPRQGIQHQATLHAGVIARAALTTDFSS